MSKAIPLTYLLADVHLQPDKHHPINQAFVAFLNHQACWADEVYILGDLFETWVGDDLSIPLYQAEIEALKALTAQGITLYIGYGNRDFLMRQAFWQASGAQFIDDETVKNIQGTNYLLLHGDRLCTDDLDYQRLRTWFHKPWVQWCFLHLPKKTRLNIAQNLRRQSGKHAQQKTAQIMDVSAQSVQKCFADHADVDHIIHGHTHRPACHTIEINGQLKHRWVLGDWRPEAKIIKIENAQISLVDV